MKFNTVDDLMKYTNNILGKTFADFDREGKLSIGLHDKGILGKVIETGFYKYENNNAAKADFDNLGIELKVTGYIKNKNGTISAKERLVLGKINYHEIIKEDYSFSKLLFKNKKILILWYEYDYTKDIKDFIITNYQLYDMSNDELVIKNDYKIIQEKVIAGKAHLLSEGDTSFLGACVKGASGQDKTTQPNSEVLAKPRAFSLKNSYLTGILRSLEIEFEIDNLEYKSVEEYVYAQIKKYIGKTQIEIYMELFEKEVNKEAIPKNIGKVLSDKMLGTDEELPEKNSLFAKTNYKIKNVPVDKMYKPLERMPFRTIRLSEFENKWENSDWKIFFEELTIIALCYEGTKEIANGYRVLKDIKKISFTEEEIESFGKTYDMIKKAIIYKDIAYLPYPNSFEGQYLEIAPKGQKGANAYDTFFLADKTKVCFMLNKEFVYKKLIESESAKMEEETDVCLNSVENKRKNILMYNIFELSNYGISTSTINILADNRIAPYHIYLNGMEALENIDILFAKKIGVINAVKLMINSNDIKRTIFELGYCGISKSTCQSLFEKGIDINKIKETTAETLIEKYGIGNAMAKKIKRSVEEIDCIIEESNKRINTQKVLEKVIKENAKDEAISLFKLKKLLENDDQYIMDNFSIDYLRLSMNGKIDIGLFGVKYASVGFADYIKASFDERIANIIIERYSGKTLESIAQVNGLTRERVRQICKKLNFENISETFDEDKYKTLFEKYNWDKKIFCNIFSESEITFNYLNERYIKGNEDLNKILFDEDIQDDAKEKYKEIQKTIVTSDGEVIQNTNEFIKKVVIKYASNEIEIEKLTEIYNSEIEKFPELQLNQMSSRNLEARLSRCDYAIFGTNHTVRYYDYEEILSVLIDKFQELLMLEDGFYSTEYLFRNNISLMLEADIRNENELHNLLKNKVDNEDNNIYFLRNPNFLVEYRDKDEFIIDKIREYSPISISDFTDMLYEEYGHKKTTMQAYIASNFSSYNKNGFLDIETLKLEDSETLSLKEHFKKDIYTIDEVESILENNSSVEIEQILTNRNLLKIGYKLRGSYVIKKEYNSIYGYLEERINNNEMLKIEEDLGKIGAIYNALNNYCKELAIFKITDNVYITSKKLESLGITREDVKRLTSDINSIFQDKDYFSLNNIINEIECAKFEEIGLGETFIEEIVSCIDGIKTLRINNNKLYSFSQKTLSIANFMYDMVNKYSSISLDDLEREISKNYQITISADKLREYLYGTEIFYSNILGKIYLDKNDYYEEVYNEK